MNTPTPGVPIVLINGVLAIDVAVVAFDGVEESGFCRPPLTLARQPVRAMAEAGIAALQAGDEPAPQLFDMDLIIRQSCGCGSQG